MQIQHLTTYSNEQITLNLLSKYFNQKSRHNCDVAQRTRSAAICSDFIYFCRRLWAVNYPAYCLRNFYAKQFLRLMHFLLLLAA